jgi:Fe-S cluster assembly ATP-binding protein
MIDSENRNLLQIDKVSLTLDGSRILDNLSLDLWEGYVHAIVGPNGAGKSTLASTIMGLEGYRDFEGDMKLDGKSLVDKGVDERAKMGITLGWQEPARFEGLPIRRLLQATAPDAQESRIAETLDKVGLAPARYLDRAADKTLSGGERKKLELASILIIQPRLVMLDEPDSGIDVESLSRIRHAIDLLKEAGCTVLLITHSQEVLSWAQHAFLMCSGYILDKGSVEKIQQYFTDRCMPCDHRNQPAFSEFAANE